MSTKGPETGERKRAAGGVDKATRRQQILQSARDVFAKHGYHAAKVEDIVHAAGVARGTFYLYFEDKRAIFEEIVDRLLVRFGMAIQRVDPTGDVTEEVKANMRRIIHLLIEERLTTKMLLSDANGVDPAFDRKIHSFFEQVRALLEEALLDGQELGIVAAGNARMQAIFVIGALKEIMNQVVVRGWDDPEGEIVEALFAFLREGVLSL
ncbi:MAG TPA: TetR/AcrR family transcriptional regulator [Polyangiaceae bacterium]|nr:TetR/AcrR family transcriptional regulator [Polyangiaceae bacterium]